MRTYIATCNACGFTETVEREETPHERLPDSVVPPKWVETAEGILCPVCSENEAPGEGAE